MTEHEPPTPHINDTDLQVLADIAKVLRPLARIDEDWHVRLDDPKGMRVCHRDGWSPGYFLDNEDWFVFVPDYTDLDPS